MSPANKPAVSPLPVVFLMGPTASGKTDIAAALSRDFPVDLISVDAAQVYRSMNIGTAKPDQDFLARYPHQLIDIRAPEQTYSAADFVSDANLAIANSHAAGRIPLLVGGTLFYFKALETGLSILPAASADLRRQIEAEMQASGVIRMHQLLMDVDPVSAARIDCNDRQRVQRAIEIFRSTGVPPAQLMVDKTPLANRLIKLTLFTPDRGILHQRIAQRFDLMLEQGLVDEVRNILKDNPGIANCPSMRTVGYRQVIEFLHDQVSYQQMMDNSVAATRQLAKRQLTWLRQQSGVTWFEAGRDASLSSIHSYLEQYFPTIEK